MARIAGDRGENIDRSIQAYDGVLAVYKNAGMTREWASTQNNLGSAYRFRPRGDRADNLQRSAQAYQASLSIRTAEALPRDSIGTGRLLGEVHLERRDWQAASKSFAVARRAFLILYGQGLQEAEARHAVAQAGTLFAGAAYAAAQRNDLATALTLASEGRARLLATSLRLQALDFSPDNRTRLEALRGANQARGASLRNGERAHQRSSAAEARGSARRAAGAGAIGGGCRRDQGRCNRARLGQHPRGRGPRPADCHGGWRQAAHSRTCQGRRSNPHLCRRPAALHYGYIDRLLRGETGKGGWLGAFNLQYLQGEERRIQEWLSAIEGIGPEVWRLFGERLQAALVERGLKPGARVMWLPAGALGLLPIGLSHNPAGGPRLVDTFELVILPSLEALDQSARQVKSATEISLAAAVNPTGEIPDMGLPFTEVEGALVARHFSGRPQTILDKTNASPAAMLAALKGKTYWHFSSHGTFDWVDARQAGLIMRDAMPLTIGALLAEEGRLGRPRLVALSACETGLYDARNNPEEFVGLPATFLQLGAAGVVATLWQVDDLATSLLIAKFYELHLVEMLSPPTALKRAQAWLREATRDELVAYGRVSAAASKLDAGKLADLEGTLAVLRRSRSTRFDPIWSHLQNRNASSPGSSAEITPARPAAVRAPLLLGRIRLYGAVDRRGRDLGKPFPARMVSPLRRHPFVGNFLEGRVQGSRSPARMVSPLRRHPFAWQFPRGTGSLWRSTLRGP